MESLYNLTLETINQVWTSFMHNWPFLVVSVLVATILKLYTDPQKVSGFLIRHKNAGIVGATAAAVGTPLCSCGTTAVVLGMMASMIPWAPIIAFMVASPLTSPEELIYSAGLFGWPFAMTYFVSSIVLGLAGGTLGAFFENRGWLRNQTRLPGTSISSRKQATILESDPASPLTPVYSFSINKAYDSVFQSSPTCACNSTDIPAVTHIAIIPVKKSEDSCACDQNSPAAGKVIISWQVFLHEILETGKRLLVMFLGFAFIGFFLNGLIPDEWVRTLFGAGNSFSIPLAATLGLPLYISSEGSLPLILSMIDGGMSQGAAMAFLITGAGTSIGAVTGALTIARWRVIALVVGTLWVGAILTGYFYNLISLTN
jgi:uncharacterized membrane protein YraQ (UPF0718 family)